MNVLPMFLNVVVPWAIFTVVCGLSSSWVMYRQPAIVWTFMVVFLIGWVVLLRKAIDVRRNDPEPSWLTYVTLMVGVAILSGILCGTMNFSRYKRPYLQIMDLKIVRDLDTGRELGQNWMDAGILEFKQGSELDGLKSWHFKHGTVYCVAPIVVNGSVPETQSYDFWAVGEDCCSISSSDFRCGSWAVAGARKGVRVIDSEAAPFYRLAVKQAESLYGIVATHPIFVRWSRDPELEVAAWNMIAFKNFILMVIVAFVFSLFFVLTAVCNFALLGRGVRMEIYGDAEWNSDGPKRSLGPATYT